MIKPLGNYTRTDRQTHSEIIIEMSCKEFDFFLKDGHSYSVLSAQCSMFSHQLISVTSVSGVTFQANIFQVRSTSMVERSNSGLLWNRKYLSDTEKEVSDYLIDSVII